MKTESTKKNGQFWKNVMIGGVPGIAIGALGTGLATSASATTPSITEVDPVSPELEPLPVAEVSDDMSFGEAFAAAREQVGPGGVFEWRGNVYNTYNAEEWEAMTPEDRAEFADRLTVTPVDIEVEAVGPEQVPETTGGEAGVAHEENGVAHEEEVTGEVDIQIAEVGTVVMEDGSEVVMATGQVEGHAAVLADVDNDGVIDAMAVDVNDNNILDDNEVVSVEDAAITVEDVALLAENNIADDPTDCLYAGTPDYINDADTSAFA